MTPTAETLLSLARLSLALGRTERITRHECGKRPESVAEHTVMLAVCALSLAEEFFPWLDRGEVARFALAHDFPEAICGDTPTLVISAEGLAAKADRELAATNEIKIATHFLPWLTNAIDDYEASEGGDSPEAAFVHAVDKLMPKLTHLLNGGVTLRESGISREDLAALLARQRADIRRSLGASVADFMVGLQCELSDLTLALPLKGDDR